MGNQITLDNWNRGGVSDSIYSGAKYSQASIVGLDLHSKPAVVRAAQKMTKDSGSTVTELCKVALACSDGNSYWCSSTSGKVWKRTSGGSWSLVGTISPAAGSAGITGVAEFNGYVYFATESRLHRITVANIATWTSFVSDWGTFTGGSTVSHQMLEVNGVLYIADKYLVAQVDETGTFTGNALDLPTAYRIKTLGRIGTDLLIGAGVDNTAIARVFRWNTFSVSWSDDTSVSEKGVNAFLMLNEAVLVSCGTQGNIYQYTGYLQPFKKIPGEYSPTSTATIHPQSWVNKAGSLLIGHSNVSGNPSKHAVWQLGRYSFSYPLVLSTDYPNSTGSLTDLEFGAIIMVGDDVFSAWGQTTGSTYGVDKIDYTTKYSGGYIETMVMAFDRNEIKNFLRFGMSLASILPDSCSLALSYKKQNDTGWSSAGEMVELYDAERVAYIIEQGVQAASLQLRIDFTTSANTTPELYDLVIGIT